MRVYRASFIVKGENEPRLLPTPSASSPSLLISATLERPQLRKGRATRPTRMSAPDAGQAKDPVAKNPR